MLTGSSRVAISTITTTTFLLLLLRWLLRGDSRLGRSRCLCIIRQLGMVDPSLRTTIAIIIILGTMDSPIH